MKQGQVYCEFFLLTTTCTEEKCRICMKGNTVESHFLKPQRETTTVLFQEIGRLEKFMGLKNRDPTIMSV